MDNASELVAQRYAKRFGKMPVPANTLRLSLLGHLAVTEQWNCSIWLRPTGSATAPTTGADASTLLGTLTSGTAWTNLKAAILAMQRSIDGLDTKALYSYATSGTSATAVATAADAGVGTGASMTHPPQVAQVMTLQTGVAGRSQRGRIYWPATAVGVSSTSELANDTLPTLRSAFAAWVLYTAGLPAGWAPYVVSQTRTSSLPVVSIRVDDRLDVQRRRANKLKAANTAVTATPWL